MNNIIQWLEDNPAIATGHWQAPVGNSPLPEVEWFSRSAVYAAKLHRLGVKQGDKIGLFFDNSPHFPAMLLAIWRLNAIAVPLSPKSMRQCQFTGATARGSDGCRIKLLIYGESTYEEVLIEWMRLCDGLAYSLEHFESRAAVSTAKHPSVKRYAEIQADDIAVYKLPDDGNAELSDAILTHRRILQLLAQSGMDLQQGHSLPLPAFISNLLSLVTLPLPRKALSPTPDRVSAIPR